MNDAIAGRLRKAGVELIPQPEPRHPYEIGVRDGDMLYLSGKTAMRDGRVVVAGPLACEDDVERGREAARLCAKQLLSAIEHTVGLENVATLLKLTVYVASAPSFTLQAEVANAASLLLREVLAEAGGHARSAIGVAVLPGDSSVEAELVVKVAEGRG